MTSTSAPSGTRASGRPRGPRRQLNNRFAIWLLLLLAAAPLPLGGNVPIAWTVYVLAIGLSAVAYALAIQGIGTGFAIPLSKIWIVAVLWLVVCLFAAFQAIPIGNWVPIAFTAASAALVPASALSLAPGQSFLTALQLLGYGLFFVLMLEVAAHESRAVLLLWLSCKSGQQH